MPQVNLTLAEVRDKLRVDKFNMDTAFEEHAEILDHIGQSVADARYRLELATQELKVLDARLMQEVRSTGEKLTVQEADALVKRNVSRGRLVQGVMDAQKWMDEWQSVHAAWNARGSALGKLANLYHDDYFSRQELTVRGGDTSERNRTAMRRAVREASASAGAPAPAARARVRVGDA